MQKITFHMNLFPFKTNQILFQVELAVISNRKYVQYELLHVFMNNNSIEIEWPDCITAYTFFK